MVVVTGDMVTCGMRGRSRSAAGPQRLLVSRRAIGGAVLCVHEDLEVEVLLDAWVCAAIVGASTEKIVL